MSVPASISLQLLSSIGKRPYLHVEALFIRHYDQSEEPFSRAIDVGSSPMKLFSPKRLFIASSMNGKDRSGGGSHSPELSSVEAKKIYEAV